MKFLKWKYGKEVPPAEYQAHDPGAGPQARTSWSQKAMAGQLVEKPQKKAPAPSDNLRKFNVFVDDEYFEVGVDDVGGPPMVTYACGPMAVPAAAPAPAPAAARGPGGTCTPAAGAPKAEAPKAAGRRRKGTPLTAPMPGMIVRYVKKVGDAVTEGETVVVLEAMKMENALPAPGERHDQGHQLQQRRFGDEGRRAGGGGVNQDQVR